MQSIKLTFTTIITIVALTLNAQNYKWDWLKGGVNGFTAYQNLTDNSGNTYVVGTIGQANTVIGTTTYNPVNGDGVLIKYDINGNVLWSVVLGGNAGEVFSGISFDANGSIYLTGYTTGSLVSVGSSTYINTGAFSFPDYAPFISKYDANGNITSLKFFGHSTYLHPNFLKINVGSNSVIINGLCMINSTLSIGNNTLNSQNTDFFIASFDLNANLNWTKFYSSPGYEGITDLTVQKNDDIYFAGITSSQSLVIGTNTLSSPNSTTNLGFLGRMNAAGNLKWFKTFANANVPNIRIASQNTNTIYIALPFSSASLSIGSNNYSSQNYDCIIAQMDSLGSYKWSKLISGNSGANILALSVNQTNYMYIAGVSSSSVLSTSNFSIANSNTVSNLFFTAFDAQGNDWGLLMSSRPNSATLNGISPYSISMDSNNNGYIVGRNNSDLICGTHTISNTTQAPTFLAKIKLLNGVGIQESLTTNNDVVIFPNPAASALNFNSQTFKNANIEIFTALGQSIFQKPDADLNQSLDVSFLNSGVYFVKIQNQFSQKTIKVIKE